MPEIAVNVAVIHDHKILLTQRDDFETWILPGGGVEQGESIARTAIRETKEETGLEVALTRLVGIYSRLGNFFGGHIVLFAAKAIGGEIKCQPGETIAVEWFPFDQIPGPLSVGHSRRIEDAISGRGGGVCVSQEIDLPDHRENIDRGKLYELRDTSGLSRQAFYLQLIRGAIIKEKIEVGDFE
jgi:ADP-ribose pyrophosphatase YjhB (NUDIX family)